MEIFSVDGKFFPTDDGDMHVDVNVGTGMSMG